MKKRVLSACILLVLAALLAVSVLYTTKHKAVKTTAAFHENMEDLTIYLASDTHYLAPELTDNGSFYNNMIRTGDGKFMPENEAINNTLIDKVIADRPDAFILAGDIAFNGARESHRQMAKMLQRIKDAGIPVLVIPGNHDFTERRAARFQGDSYELVDSIDATEFLELYGDLGPDDALSRDETSLSYVTELSPHVRILCVDVNTVVGLPGILTNSTLEYVEKELQKAKEDGAYVIGVTHQTLLVHSELTSQGMSFIGAEKLQELYEKYGVLMNLSGHMHIQHIVESKNGLTDIATGSVMTSPNYYAKLDLSEKAVRYEAIPLTVERVSDFEEQSHAFLWANSLRQGQESLIADGVDPAEFENTDSDAYRMAAFFADFNTSYIAGHSDRIPWDDAMLARWDKTDTFVPKYFDLVQKEGARDFTKWTLKEAITETGL